MGVVGRTRIIFGSSKISFPDILVAPGYVAWRIIQVIVCDAKTIAEALPISLTMQSFPDKIFFPLFVVILINRLVHITYLISKGNHLFKHLLPAHAITLNKP
jgi:hypothetical protein